MGLINPRSLTTISPKRPTEDFGDETFTDLAPIGAVVSLGKMVLFVPRGADLMGNDKFLYQGREFRVMGWPQGDQDHPLTGDDLGWMWFAIEASTPKVRI